MEIHEDFIQSCFDRLKASYDTLCVLDGDKDSINCARQEAIRMVRVLTVLKEYINECDSDYHEERSILPMSRYCQRTNPSVVCATEHMIHLIENPYVTGRFVENTSL